MPAMNPKPTRKERRADFMRNQVQRRNAAWQALHSAERLSRSLKSINPSLLDYSEPVMRERISGHQSEEFARERKQRQKLAYSTMK